MSQRTLETLHKLASSGKLSSALRRSDGVREIALCKIMPDPDQPRKAFDASKLSELSDNIRAHGVLQAIIVQPANAEGVHTIIMGERRYRASQAAGLETIPAIIKEATSELRAVQLSENIQRQELTPLEIAQCIDHMKSEGRSRKDIARLLGWSPSQISLFSGILKMPDCLQDLASQSVPVRALCDLHKLWQQDREGVESFLDATDVGEITRVRVEELGSRLACKKERQPKGGSDEPVPCFDEVRYRDNVLFYCDQDGEIGRVLTDRLGSSETSVMVSFDDGSRIEEIALSALNIVKVVEV